MVEDLVAARLAVMVSAFNECDSPEAAAQRLSRFAVPGDLATRSRWRFLLDPLRPSVDPRRRGLETAENWRVDVEMETAAEIDAVNCVSSIAQWRALAERERQPHYRVLEVNAMLGLADEYRRGEQHDSAARIAADAAALASGFGYRFGVMRAEIVTGYVALAQVRGHDAGAHFREAAQVARSLDERLYEANSWLGSGQAHLARGRRRPARAYARKARRCFVRLGSAVGVDNADILLTAAGEAPPVEEAVASEYPEGTRDVVGQIEAQIAAADALLGRGEPAAAADLYTAVTERARGIYPRGEAHGWFGLGKILESVDEQELARDAFDAAQRLYREITDTTGRAYTDLALSRVATALGDGTASLRHDQDAIVAIESLLNTDARAQTQTELGERFSTVYRHAITNALTHQDPQSLIITLENLAGRRLAGIATSGVVNVAEAWLSSGLAVLAAERAAGRAAPRDPDEPNRVVRSIGRAALRVTIPELAGRDLEDAIRGIHEPTTSATLEPLLHALPPHTHTLVISPVPGSAARVAWWHRNALGETSIGSLELDGAAHQLLTQFSIVGISRTLLPDDLRPLRSLIPSEAVEEARGGIPLLLVALGRLADVPWTAVPVGERFLGELAPLVRCPSLGLHRAVALRVPVQYTDPQPISVWRNPTVEFTTFTQLADSPQWAVTEPATVAGARQAVQRPSAPVVAIACHGRPSRGIGHYLDLGDETFLTAADCLNADPPATVALVSCWGARSPATTGRDPLSIANVLLARGSREVLATIGELGDSPQAALLIDDFLYDLATMSAAEAFHNATVRYLRMPAHRDGPLYHWAPATILGTF